MYKSILQCHPVIPYDVKEYLNQVGKKDYLKRQGNGTYSSEKKMYTCKHVKHVQGPRGLLLWGVKAKRDIGAYSM